MNEVRGVPTERLDDSSTDEIVSEIPRVEPGTPTKSGKQFGQRLVMWGGILVAGVLLLIGFFSTTAPGPVSYTHLTLPTIYSV